MPGASALSGDMMQALSNQQSGNQSGDLTRSLAGQSQGDTGTAGVSKTATPSMTNSVPQVAAPVVNQVNKGYQMFKGGMVPSLGAR